MGAITEPDRPLRADAVRNIERILDALKPDRASALPPAGPIQQVPRAGNCWPA